MSRLDSLSPACLRAMLAPESGTGSTVTHRWLAEVGYNYVLQVSPDLVTPAWSNASGPLTATAAVLNAVATNAMPINYYRAVRTD